MNDIFLKFSDRSEMLAIFETLDLLLDNQTIVTASIHYAAWEVGEIAGRDGWHVNLRIVDPTFDISALESYRVYPQNPVCVWA